jgi:hypothetical protein
VRIVEKIFDFQIRDPLVVDGGHRCPRDDQIIFAVTESGSVYCRGKHIISVQHHARVFFGEPLKNSRDDHRRMYIGASDLQHTYRRISQKFDVSDALPEFIEYHRAAPDQGVTVHRGPNALCAAIKQPHTERRLKVANCLGDRGLSDFQMCGRFGHAARLHNREEHVQITQPQAPTDLALPIDGSGHRLLAIWVETN